VQRSKPRVGHGDSRRDSLPQFTILPNGQKDQLNSLFREWRCLFISPVIPGRYACGGIHPMLRPVVSAAMADAGFEIRTAHMRLSVSVRAEDRR
jgi:hypothetical protein